MTYRFWIGEIHLSLMGVSSKLRPGKLRPQTSDPKTHLCFLPPHPSPARVAHPLEAESHVVSYWVASSSLVKIMKGDVLRECAQRLMQAAEQIQIRQNSLTARNNTGARRESQPTQTASGPKSLNSTTSPRSVRSALSAAGRSVGDLEGPQNTAGPAWEEHRRIFGYRPSSGASRSRPGGGNSRGRGKRQPAAFSPYFHRKDTWTRAFVCPAFSEQNSLPSTSESKESPLH